MIWRKQSTRPKRYKQALLDHPMNLSQTNSVTCAQKSHRKAGQALQSFGFVGRSFFKLTVSSSTIPLSSLPGLKQCRFPIVHINICMYTIHISGSFFQLLWSPWHSPSMDRLVSPSVSPLTSLWACPSITVILLRCDSEQRSASTRSI